MDSHISQRKILFNQVDIQGHTLTIITYSNIQLFHALLTVQAGLDFLLNCDLNLMRIKRGGFIYYAKQ
jgi:hypothetical protein